MTDVILLYITALAVLAITNFIWQITYNTHYPWENETDG